MGLGNGRVPTFWLVLLMTGPVLQWLTRPVLSSWGMELVRVSRNVLPDFGVITVNRKAANMQRPLPAYCTWSRYMTIGTRAAKPCYTSQQALRVAVKVPSWSRGPGTTFCERGLTHNSALVRAWRDLVSQRVQISPFLMSKAHRP